MPHSHQFDELETVAAPAPHHGGGWRRVTVRLFFLVFAAVVVIDVAPSQWPWMRPVKQAVCPRLNYCGLWQGQWTLFAPSPILNNAWLSAEIYRPDGSQQEVWNSTYWANSSGWERFLGFRHMNYRNSMGAAAPAAANDLADYLARQLISPTAHPIEQPVAEVAQTFGGSPTSPETLGEFRYDQSQPGAVSDTNRRPQQPTWRLVLTRSQLSIVLPHDGTLPKRDETLWISSSKNLAVREYLP